MTTQGYAGATVTVGPTVPEARNTLRQLAMDLQDRFLSLGDRGKWELPATLVVVEDPVTVLGDPECGTHVERLAFSGKQFGFAIELRIPAGCTDRLPVRRLSEDDTLPVTVTTTEEPRVRPASRVSGYALARILYMLADSVEKKEAFKFAELLDEIARAEVLSVPPAPYLAEVVGALRALAADTATMQPQVFNCPLCLAGRSMLFRDVETHLLLEHVKSGRVA